MNIVQFPLDAIRRHPRAAELEAAGVVRKGPSGSDVLELDFDAHRHLFAHPQASYDPPAEQPAGEGGPGTELKKLLKSWLGIVATPNCSCNAHAAQMDEWGPDGCEKPEHFSQIVGWLEEQAKGRKLPFVRFAAEQAVKLAIRRARKTAQ